MEAVGDAREGNQLAGTECAEGAEEELWDWLDLCMYLNGMYDLWKQEGKGGTYLIW